jgi:rare lipoprotein A (peptidoglycan hydrolase)
VFGAPFLLLQHNGVTTLDARGATKVHPPSALDRVDLQSHLVAYEVQSTPALPGGEVIVASEPVSDTIITAPPVTTTPPVVRPVISGNTMHGQATWYPEAAAGTCASHFLPRGTVVTVTNDATGASVTCLIDDYEVAGYPRVLDMSFSGFSQLEDPSRGVMDVTISW